MNTAPNTSHRAGAGDQLALFAAAIVPSGRARFEDERHLPQEEAAAASCGTEGIDISTVTPFMGTKQKRLLRLLDALMVKRRTRRQVDVLMNTVNGPALIAELRQLGLEIPNTQFRYTDGDGRTMHASVYALTPLDKVKVNLWRASCNG